jgi:glycosyltransferase involved in cell wall biosynthesis
MLRLVASLPPSVAAAVACPPEGRLVAVLDARGIARHALPGTSVSFRLHPRDTPRGVAGLARSARAVATIARRVRADVVHANGTRAGLIAAPAARARRAPPLVVQVHDRLPHSPLGRATRLALAGGAERVIAVSQATADAFDAGLGRPVARVVPISFDHERFRPGLHDPAEVRRSLGLPPDGPLLGEVAQITPWKGQLVAIEAFARVAERHPDAHLLIVGSVAFASGRWDNQGYLEALRERVRALGLHDRVRFLGQRGDVPAIMAALDLLLLPSWEEPFGTVVVEGMAMGTVPLASADGGMAEYVEDGVSGRLLAPREPERWAQAALELLADPARRAAMGARATEVAARFTDEAYASGCLRAYEEAVAERRGAGHSPPRRSMYGNVRRRIFTSPQNDQLATYR